MRPKKIEIPKLTPEKACRLAKKVVVVECLGFLGWLMINIGFIVHWLSRMYTETPFLSVFVLTAVLAPLFRSCVRVRSSIDSMRKACSMTTPTQ